jgi:hypothetical protein
MFAIRIRMLTATLWVGSLWTIGYMVAPTLFASEVERSLAGTLAGRMFRVEAWLSVFCALLLLALLKFGASDKSAIASKQLMRLVIGMLLCTLIGYFGLQPFMNALREAAGPEGVMESAMKLRFGLLHGISSVFYLIQSLLGVALVLKIR